MRMDLKRLYNNPEVKRVTIKFIIIFIIGISIIFVASYGVVKNINKTLIDQNTSVLSSVIEGEDINHVIKGFYEIKTDEEINEAKKLLKSYGYDDDLSIITNEVTNKFYIEIFLTFLPISIIFTVLLYLIFIKELKGIYSKLDCAIKSISKASSGEFESIKGVYEEGDLAVLINSLNYMGDRANKSIHLLKEEKEYLKDFLSDISHQLKTPLASLVMFTDIMKENENMLFQDRRKFLEKCEEQQLRMEWLIMNLLKVGRLEAGVVNFCNEKQPLRETINLAISSLIEGAKKRNQRLAITGDLDCELLHDRRWLGEAISNIVKNAIEHTEEGKEIEIRVSSGKLITKIYIKDNGPGIPKEHINNVFKRFYKGEGSINPKSIGIGLSLSKSIIEELGGEIRLISEEGVGTTFIISFIHY
jgi:signal transduction histidine kinase